MFPDLHQIVLQAWNLQFSDPNRGGKFLNIPIHYGDWVPITAAKALVEEVANRQRQVPRERVHQPGLQTLQLILYHLVKFTG